MKMKMKMKRRMLHMENAIHRHDSDIDVPVTKQEELLCTYITDEIEEEFSHLGLTCSCSWHNPGEERHIEIFVGIPEGDDPDDPKYANLENDLELFVNEIGEAENEGEKWGDASFQWLDDTELFGEIWPLEESSQVNEVSGWNLEDEDLTLVNSEEDGDRLYIVKMWWGSGYQMDCYNAYAFDEEEALNYVVAYIEKTHPEWLKASDKCAHDMMKEYDEESPEFQETFMYVDATREGAKKAHYIWAENLGIA